MINPDNRFMVTVNMFKFFTTSVLFLIIGITFLHICQTSSYENYFHAITSVTALPNPVSLGNCSTTIYCIVKSFRKPYIHWVSSYLGDINETSSYRGLGTTYISQLGITDCFRNATYTCVSHYENQTEMSLIKVRLEIKEWECLDDSDCKPYTNSKCQEHLCLCKNETSCIGKDSPPIIKDLQPFNNDHTVAPNHCYKSLICEIQGYEAKISWGIIGDGVLQSSGSWYSIRGYKRAYGTVVGELIILKCRKNTTYFCEASNQQGSVSSTVTICMKLVKYQCWDNTDCAIYNATCVSNLCHCSNGYPVSTDNCTNTKSFKEQIQINGLSKTETNIIIVLSIVGAILITNFVIFVIYRISRRKIKSSTTELLNSNKY